MVREVCLDLVFLVGGVDVEMRITKFDGERIEHFTLQEKVCKYCKALHAGFYCPQCGSLTLTENNKVFEQDDGEEETE